MGNAPEKPVPAPRGGLTFPVTFSIRDSGHCPRAEHPPPAPRQRGKSQLEGRTGNLLLSPAPPVPQRSTAPARVLPRPIQGRRIPAGFPDTRLRDCLRSGSPGQRPLMNFHISDNPTETLSESSPSRGYFLIHYLTPIKSFKNVFPPLLRLETPSR